MLKQALLVIDMQVGLVFFPVSQGCRLPSTTPASVDSSMPPGRRRHARRLPTTALVHRPATCAAARCSACLATRLQNDFCLADAVLCVQGAMSAHRRVIQAVDLARRKGIPVIWVIREHEASGARLLAGLLPALGCEPPWQVLVGLLALTVHPLLQVLTWSVSGSRCSRREGHQPSRARQVDGRAGGQGRTGKGNRRHCGASSLLTSHVAAAAAAAAAVAVAAGQH